MAACGDLLLTRLLMWRGVRQVGEGATLTFEAHLSCAHTDEISNSYDDLLSVS